MKILIVNKFLYPNGGSETYIFEIGKQLQKMGHEVQYFGMEHEGRIVGNHANSYTSNMDFHSGKLQKLLYPFKIIYSKEARKKIRTVLDDYQPDVVHLNNINFQITPSIIYEIRDYEKQDKKKIKIVFTAHDYQWICPNHMLYIPQDGNICERCLTDGFWNCTRNKCIHGSRIKSLLGTLEAIYYHKRKTYKLVDTIICPSQFLYSKFAQNSLYHEKLIIMHNFIPESCHKITTSMPDNVVVPERYVLYFGRYAKEKGILTLLEVCRELSDISFVFAGSGPLESEVNKVPNIKNVRFMKGKALQKLISESLFSVYPSEWYENCPFSVMESQIYGTPVLGAKIGGIPELIRNCETGELFESGNKEQLKEKIQILWNNQSLQKQYSAMCTQIHYYTTKEYCEKLQSIYGILE